MEKINYTHEIIREELRIENNHQNVKVRIGAERDVGGEKYYGPEGSLEVAEK